MAYVPVPKDLTKIKVKVLLNLTKRQIICFSAAAIVGIPAYLLTRGLIGNSAAALLMIGMMLPFFFLAMYERDGQPAEKILRNMLRARLWPGVCPYRTQNFYKYLNEGGKSIAIQSKTAGAASAKKRHAGKRK